MIKRFLGKANSLLLAAAMTVTMMPAQMVSAAGTDGAAVLQQAEGQAGDAVALAQNLEPITVIEGNAPVLPERVSADASEEIQWNDWDTNAEAGDHTLTGATSDGTQVAVKVTVLPCDEAVPDVRAMGTSDSSAQEKADAIHSLKGYKGLFVAEYDIVPDSAKSTHDRAVIYLPDRILNNGNWEELHAENCWDTGARLQFKHSYNDVTYFQTQDGDGQVASNAVYYPTNNEINQAVDNNETIALPFDEVSTYRVRTVMDTASDTTKGNVKIYITGPDGIQHEVTKSGGNGFRIYPENGIVSQFAAVRGSYTLKNHKISWISGFATRNTEFWLKEQNAADYVKDDGVMTEKEIPGTISQPQLDTELLKNNKKYVLDTEKSGWYLNNQKVSSVTAAEGETVTYRAYYACAAEIDKTALNEKIQKAEALIAEDYTVASWNAFADALVKAKEANTDAAVSQEAVNAAAQALDTAEGNLVSIKNLRAAIDALKAELEATEGQKTDYTNWDEVKSAVEDAEKVLNRTNATKSQVEAAEKKLEIRLISNAKLEAEAAKKAMDSSVAAAEQKIAGIKEADYTPESWKALKDALEACKKLNPETASKADYDTCKAALDRAVQGLTKQTGNPVEQPTEVKVESIQRAAKTYKIAAGKKLDLKKVFTALPENADNRKLTYSIDKKYNSYASIKSGVVTVKRKGAGKTIVVKAAAADGSGKTSSVKIKIMKNAVTKITVKKKSLTVKAGQKVTIKPVVRTNGKSANKTLEYTSSNEKLATVKKGVVTTKKGKNGKVTITIKSTDGTNRSVKVQIRIKK